MGDTYRSIGFIRTDEGTKPHPHDTSRHRDGELLPYHQHCVEVFVKLPEEEGSTVPKSEAGVTPFRHGSGDQVTMTRG